MENTYRTKGAFALARDIKAGKISSFELTSFYIGEIKKWNTVLNAVVEERYETALEEARKCDEVLKNNPAAATGVLFGVPMTVKEMISLEGFNWTAGCYHRQGKKAAMDATVVKRLRAAGAIVMCTTNVPEVGLWFECSNPIYGVTTNPYDRNRTPGGSSGGEAALLAAGATPLGIGSDIGGSLRIPAAFCGIFAHKPSEKWIPVTGQYPYSPEELSQMKGSEYPFTVVGPMTRQASDLAPMFQLLLGPDEWDQETIPRKFDTSPVSWKDRKVYVLRSPKIRMTASPDTEVSEATEKAAQHFASLGADVQQLPPDIFKDAFQLWSARSMSVERKTFVEHLAPGIDFGVAKELGRWAWAKMTGGKIQYQFTSLLTALVEKIGGEQKNLIQKKLTELSELKAKLETMLGPDAVIVMPPHPRPAPVLGSTLLRPFDFCYTAIFNALGFPASVSPAGFCPKGLPLSVQVIAATDRDHLCIRAAEELEKAFGGWKPPPVSL